MNMNMSVEEKRKFLMRNLYAYIGGLLLVVVFVYFAPLYDIFEEFKITYIDKTLPQIMTRYVFVILIAAFTIFTVGFYLIKRILLSIHNKQKMKHRK